MPKIEYCITDGNKFVKQAMNNQYKLVSNMSLADVWYNPEVAKSILNNSIPRVWRGSFYVGKLKDGEVIKCSRTDDEKKELRNELNPSRKDSEGYNLDLYSFEKDIDVQNLIKGFSDIQKILVETEGLREQLEKKIATLEFVLEDLKHYRLKKKLGTVNSYKFKLLGDKAVVKRLSLKNRLEILHKINQHREAIASPIKDICTTIESVKNRKYIPRALPDLFENDNLDIDI